jgi:hypothetical protein
MSFIFHRFRDRLEREGFDTMFALGLLQEEEDVRALGLRDVDLISFEQELERGPRRLVALWTPSIRIVPTTVPARVWLGNLPVNLTMYAEPLAKNGFETLSALRHVTLQDCREMGIKDGHARVLAHCASNMGPIFQELPAISVTLDLWLSLISPPLDHCSKAIKLFGIKKVLDLASVSEQDIMDIVIRRGHQRVLQHYARLVRQECAELKSRQ